MKRFFLGIPGPFVLIRVVALLASTSCQAQTFKTLASFNGTTYPIGVSLVQGKDGNFYGTTGGPNDCGTVFKVTPGGTLTTIHTLVCPVDGASPQAGLILAADGNFYGTAFIDGPAAGGTVFRVTPEGVMSNVYAFHAYINGMGNYPTTKLVQASDGNFYGTTSGGSVSIPSRGIVFNVTPQGVYTNFRGSISQSPSKASALVQGTDGNFYGTTEDDGQSQGGTFFTVTPSGTLTTLYTFSDYFGPDGVRPYGGVIQGTDGNFYGTTEGGGTNQSSGTVFRITPSGTLTTLYSFGPTEGYAPLGGLVQGVDGNFYGTTSVGGNGYGTIFRITPGGLLTTLHAFAADGSEGSGGGFFSYSPMGSLVQGADGNLYGTTYAGGASGVGTVFRLQLAPSTPYACTNSVPPAIASVESASAYGGYPYFASGSWLEIKGVNLADPADPRLTAATNPGQWTASDFAGVVAPTSLDGIHVSINGKPAYIWYLSPGQLNVQAPEDTATGNVPITVTNCNATSSPIAFARRALAPGLLAPANYTANATQYMVATFASDGAYVLDTASGAAFGLNSRPAKPGDLIIGYGIGFGTVTPSISPGVIVGQSNTLVNPVAVSFGSIPATLSYSGLAGNFVGLYEFYVTVPSTLANGDYQINVTQNGTPVPQTMYVTVHN